MPRDTATEVEEKVVKKTPRKRAAPKKTAVAKKTTPRKTAVKKTTPRKTTATKSTPKKKAQKEEGFVEEEELQVVESVVGRKAPTKFSAEEASKRSKRNQMIVIGVLLLLGVGSSAVVGFTDEGQINVTQTIKDRNERMANLVDVDDSVVIAPTPSRLPDGGLTGLRPSVPQVKPVVPPPQASSTATTTANLSDTASSTATTTVTGETTDSVILNDPDTFATDTATTTVEATSPPEGV
jgi:hypothetical protein